MKAVEYESDIYLSQTRVPELPATTWESETLPTKELIEELQRRGWHTTDIGDALDEARTAQRREA